ncbi:MAG: SMP-30/gluconolactonase/LRE family protein, partial [Steroidobacteraceae bacterium]|nr:SMP-30/gluconolactonase/LRE family protein [Steroidobacteraceae bacterium]
MTLERYPRRISPICADGWEFETLTPPSRLVSANGLRTGSDGRIYVAQFIGSRISAIDVDSGIIEHISDTGGDIVAPDDIAFDSLGNLYATEVMDARVSVRTKAGHVRILRDDLPAANGITIHQDRLFVDECRLDGRLIELDLSGRLIRTLAENLPFPNALEVGPDGLLYFPVMAANEIWRIDPDGGEPERVAAGLGRPDAVKFDSRGCIVSTQLDTGHVLRIDPRTGRKEVLAQLDPGLDNLTFVGERLFVSHYWDGRVTEIVAGGGARTVIPGGLCWPLGLAVADDGAIFIADGYSLRALRRGGQPQTIGRAFGTGFPGTPRGIARLDDGRLAITTLGGQVCMHRPYSDEYELVAEGFDQLYGVAARGRRLVVAERGAGRVLSVGDGRVEVLARGLDEPMGVAVTADRSCIVSEAGAGRIVKVSGSGVETLFDGLLQPHGLLVRQDCLYVVDAGSKALVAYDL